MRLDLREIIHIPGESVAFDFEPDLSGARMGSVREIGQSARARGRVYNSAGVLKLTAQVEAVLSCDCARCLKAVELPVRLDIGATLVEGSYDGEEPDVLVFEGDFFDVGEAVATEFILNLQDRVLCTPDCKGLCEGCGADLNKGPCGCAAQTDPRLDALRGLLDSF